MKRYLFTVLLSFMMAFGSICTSFAGSWRKDTRGWWYQNDDGSYPAGTWQWIDSNGDGTAECYYFYADGYMACNNEIGGYRVNQDGQWVIGERVQTMKVESRPAKPDYSSVSLDAYKAAILDKNIIESNNDFDYLRMYFKDEYGFDKYFLHDLNSDGVPEMFVYSANMGLTAVYTIDGGLKFLEYQDISGINLRTGEVVINGHWHGAGGSGVYEWHTYGMKDGSMVMTRSIDYLPYDENSGRYSCFDAAAETYNDSNRAEYDRTYQDIMNGFRSLSAYRLYDLGDLAGLNNIQ